MPGSWRAYCAVAATSDPGDIRVQGIKGRLTKGAVWLAATRVIVNLAAFGNTVLLARFLVPADFGLVALATTVTAIVASVTELSMGSALVQHAAPTEDHFDTAWTLNFARALLMGAVIVALAQPVAWFYGDGRLVAIMLVVAFSTLLSGLFNPKLVVFARNLVFWQEFALGVSQKLTGLVAAATVVLLFRSYWALVAGMLASQLSGVVLSYMLKPYRPRLRLTRVRELLSFSVWLTMAQVVNTLNYRFDHLAIGYVLGSAPLGTYTVGDTISSLPTREAMAPIAQTLFPGFARLRHDPARLRLAYRRAQAFLCAVALPVGFGFAAIAKPLILLAMGPAWLPAVLIVQMLSCNLAFGTLASTVQPVAMAVGATRGLFRRDLLVLAVRLPLIVVGLWAGGLVGVLCARMVSGLLGTLLNMMLVTRLIGLSARAQLAANARSLTAVAVMLACMLLVGGAAAAATPVAAIAGMVTTGAAAYLGTLYVLWRGAGRPAGPESEAIRFCAQLVARAAPGWVRAPEGKRAG